MWFNFSTLVSWYCTAFFSYRRGWNGHYWAQPDAEHLKLLLRHVYENREEAKEKGLIARKDIGERFSLQVMGKILTKHFERILNSQIFKSRWWVLLFFMLHYTALYYTNKNKMASSIWIIIIFCPSYTVSLQPPPPRNCERTQWCMLPLAHGEQWRSQWQ